MLETYVFPINASLNQPRSYREVSSNFLCQEAIAEESHARKKFHLRYS